MERRLVGGLSGNRLYPFLNRVHRRRVFRQEAMHQLSDTGDSIPLPAVVPNSDKPITKKVQNEN